MHKSRAHFFFQYSGKNVVHILVYERVGERWYFTCFFKTHIPSFPVKMSGSVIFNLLLCF